MQVESDWLESGILRDKNARILVAGAGGFIGGHLVSFLCSRGFTNVLAVDIKPLSKWHQVIPSVQCVTADLSLREVAMELSENCRIVLNLAADMGGMGFIERNRALCMLSVLINTHLLLAAKHHGIERYFFASSACVYPAHLQSDADVVALHEDSALPAMPEIGYGWEKLFSEQMCEHFNADFGVPVRVARYHNVYGPIGTWFGGREKAPAAICRKVALATLHGNHEIEIWGDGKQTRSFTYIDDCIEGTLRLVNSEYVSPINIGSSELVSINDLVSVVEKVAGTSVERSYDLSAPLGVRGRNSDNTRIKQILGWEPSTSLEDGIAKTYAWVFNQIKSTTSW